MNSSSVLMRVHDPVEEKAKSRRRIFSKSVKAEYSLFRDYSDAELQIIAGEISKRDGLRIQPRLMKGVPTDFSLCRTAAFCYDNLLRVASFRACALGAFALI